MTVSAGSTLKGVFNNTQALGDKIISSDATFEIEGAEDISLLIKQFPWPELSVGGEIEVPTIDGKKARVTVPEGTQTGKQFRLKSKGMPVLRARQTGDMYVQVVVETPQNLTKKQKELLQEFEGEGTAEKTSPESAGFFAKVKELWTDLKN